MRSQTSAKFSQCGANCQTGSSVRHEPCHTIGAASGAAGSTNVLCRRSGSSSASWRVVAIRQRDVHDGSSSPSYENVTGSAG